MVAGGEPLRQVPNAVFAKLGAPSDDAAIAALQPAAPGSIGAAHGYDNAGHLTVLATFTDKNVALLELTVP